MSVAFRRESDEEHLEPKFELPLPPGPNLVTARGLAMISAQVVELDAALAAATDDPARAAIKRDLRYWGAMAIGGAFGTVGGDCVSHGIGLPLATLWQLDLNGLRYGLAEIPVRRRLLREFEAEGRTLGL